MGPWYITKLCIIGYFYHSIISPCCIQGSACVISLYVFPSRDIFRGVFMKKYHLGQWCIANQCKTKTCRALALQSPALHESFVMQYFCNIPQFLMIYFNNIHSLKQSIFTTIYDDSLPDYRLQVLCSAALPPVYHVCIHVSPHPLTARTLSLFCTHTTHVNTAFSDIYTQQ